jgi:hypothetical protein
MTAGPAGLRPRPGERPEELLFDLGLADELTFALDVAARTGRPFAGLRGFVPDLGLFAYLPLPLALRERLCPLSLGDDTLRLASVFAEPDLSYLRRSFPSLGVELTIARRSELLAALDVAVGLIV